LKGKKNQKIILLTIFLMSSCERPDGSFAVHQRLPIGNVAGQPRRKSEGADQAMAIVTVASPNYWISIPM
jgi:hypothetical protein